MDIVSYIANTSMNLSAAKLQSDVSVAMLKKTMEASEASAANLIESIASVQPELVPNFEGSINLRV